MHRLIVVILSAVDAAIAAAVGIAATLAPLTLLWVLGMGGTADWGLLWPTSATVWQFGNLVPLQVTLPGDYLAVAGIDPGAASFVLSLAPLAFASFTAIFAARSGVRASQADAWVTGVLTGSLGFAALTAVIALSSGNDLAAVERWQAILFPSLVFAIPLLVGAVVTEWREAGSGFIARARDRIEAAPHEWGEVPGLIVRGGAVALAGLIGLGALAFAVSLVLRGGEVIALYEAAHVDALGATVITLAQLAYLPTLAIWGMAFVAGPGFAVGTGTAVSPAGTQLGPVPGIPALGALPESTTPWLLLLALLPVALGGLAGWIARSRLVAPPAVAEAAPPALPIDDGRGRRPRPQLGTRGSAGGCRDIPSAGRCGAGFARHGRCGAGHGRCAAGRGTRPAVRSDRREDGHRAGHRRAGGRGRGPAVRPGVGVDRSGPARRGRSAAGGRRPRRRSWRCCSARRSCCSRRDAARRPRRRARRRPRPRRRR